MKMYVGITDNDWYITLRESNYDEINFWRPGGKTSFKALNEGDLFLFKLHNPYDYIVGGGYFFRFLIINASLAWEAFNKANGTSSLVDLYNRIYKYKKTNHFTDPDPQIGCIILSMPFYFEQKDWIPVPSNWKYNIVQGKTYDTTEYHGKILFEQVMERLHNQRLLINDNKITNRYGKEQIIKPRLGQGSFKLLVTEAYHKRCAITAEKTLPVLEAAHIKPYSLNGPHEISNGLLLRRDFHTLFDRGYITVDKNLTIEVSHRIKEDYGNGKEYYLYHGKKLSIIPENYENMPNKQYLEWHNKNIYLG